MHYLLLQVSKDKQRLKALMGRFKGHPYENGDIIPGQVGAGSLHFLRTQIRVDGSEKIGCHNYITYMHTAWHAARQMA